MQFENDKLLYQYYKDIKDCDPLPHGETVRLIVRAQKGDQKAFEKIIKSNLKFVITVAKSYQNQGHPLLDLINDGNVGLINAIKRFDVTKGFRFISYAVWWVRESINTSLNENSRIVRIPVNHINRIRSSKESINDFINKNGRLPSKGEELSNGEIVDEFLLPDSFTSHSLDNLISDNDDLTYMDLINVQPKELVLDENKIDNEIHNILDELSEREKNIVIKYYGMLGEEPRTLQDLSGEYGITLERVRQIKDKAIRNLRHNSKRLYELINNKR